MEVKKVAKDTNWLYVIIAIVAIYLIYQYTAKPVVTPGGQCAVNPSVVSVITDTLNAGTAVTPTNYYRLNGMYAGSTAPTTSGVADILITSSNYISKIHTGFPLNCGSNLLTDNVYANTSATLTVYSNNGLKALSNSATGGAYNETVGSAGGSYNWKIHFQGVDKKSTGQQLVVAELSVPANVSSLSLSGATITNVPNGYSRQLTNGYAAAWLVPAVIGNVAVDNNLAATASTNYVIRGAVYVTVYHLQPFVETDGTFNAGTVAFDSLNTNKAMAKTTYNFCINSDASQATCA